MIVRAIDQGLDYVAGRFAFAEEWLLGTRKASYGVAVVRIVFGLTALWFLAANWRNRHYLWGDAAQWNSPLDRNGGFDWPFTALGDLGGAALSAGILGLAALLIAFTLGWRTRVIAPIVLVLWVSLIESNPVYGDQSDNIFRILLFYLCFADLSGRWSVDARRRQRQAGRTRSRLRHHAGLVATLLHNLAVLAVGVQICIIYVASGLYKAQGATWQDGTAVYYPLQVSHYQPWPAINDLLSANAFGVLAVSYFSVFIQIFFPLMLLRRTTRIIAIVGVSAMHLGIAVFMGLPFFSLFIMAGDQIFVRDRTYLALRRAAGRRWSSWRDRYRSRRRGRGRIDAGSEPDPAVEQPTRAGVV